MGAHYLNLALIVLGSLVLGLGLVSRKLEASPLPPTVIALAVGVFIGPAGLELVALSDFGERTRILEYAARLTLGIGLIGVALRVPRRFPRRHARELTVLLVVGMLLMWMLSTTLVHLLLGLPLELSALIGAIITPTDPIAATPIVTGDVAKQHVPERIRNLISFESGANDGLGYLLVFLPSLLMLLPADRAWRHWFMETVLWEVGVATMFGLALGYAAGVALKFAERHRLIEEKWRLVYTVALALLATGAGRLIKSDELLVVFAAGAMFVQVVSSGDRKNEEHGQEAINRFFALPFFAVLGMALPWEGWAKLGTAGGILAVAVLLLRRPLPLWVMQRALPSVHNRADALFVGWFGPIAVAAVYYAMLMSHRMGEPRIWHVVSLVVCASVLAHGMTAVPLTRWYGRHTEGKRGHGGGNDDGHPHPDHDAR
ncbi:cation:proton antiporter [Cognatilysobacter bugurensis]|uniref:Cation/H+ exchanger transmembrane domain-containing protein n=1 Tax=Cognatilysobacter bugurensis TaxID=543356 RepID=A0A918W4R0_9GAMM|nr:cation:proton antiporter [Lysobacter bugurensis]GHA68451.1 hypothetical protein GCM10007067_00360 [Lysobacter bugurensis]